MAINQSIQWVKIVVALLTVLGAIAVAWIQYRKPSEATKPMSPMHDFSGFITDESGAPVAHAQVRVYRDTAVPEAVYSDSAGVFTVLLPDSAKTVIVVVSAEGFKSFDQNEPVTRTTPLQIRLTKIEPYPSSKATPSQRPAHSPIREIPILATAPEPPHQVVNAPNGIGTIGGTLVNPTVNNNYGVSRPPPIAFGSKGDIGPLVSEFGSCRELLCATITIEVADYFQSPHFLIETNQRFSIIGTRIGHNSGRMLTTTNGIQVSYTDIMGTAPAYRVAVRRDDGPLAPDMLMILIVRPEAPKSFEVKVTSIPQ